MNNFFPPELYCLDKYFYIDPLRDEPSVETGLTAWQIHEIRTCPGAGGTITNNLRALGAQVHCVGIAGDDGEGYDLLKELRKIDAKTDDILVTDRWKTSTYMKPMRKTENADYVEMNRLDIRMFSPTPPELEELVLSNFKSALGKSQGIIISDQYLLRNCSVITDRVRHELAELAKSHPNIFFYADSRGFVSEYRNMIVKCNHHELINVMMPDYSGEITENLIHDCGRQLQQKNNVTLVVTMGEAGVFIFDADEIKRIPAFRVTGPIDIVGAGDACNAGIMLGLTLGLCLTDAVLLGNCVSSITIKQIGITGTATISQVKQRFQEANFSQVCVHNL